MFMYYYPFANCQEVKGSARKEPLRSDVLFMFLVRLAHLRQELVPCALRRLANIYFCHDGRHLLRLSTSAGSYGPPHLIRFNGN